MAQGALESAPTPGHPDSSAADFLERCPLIDAGLDPAGALQSLRFLCSRRDLDLLHDPHSDGVRGELVEALWRLVDHAAFDLSVAGKYGTPDELNAVRSGGPPRPELPPDDGLACPPA
jgi:hypothetical protein